MTAIVLRVAPSKTQISAATVTGYEAIRAALTVKMPEPKSYTGWKRRNRYDKGFRCLVNGHNRTFPSGLLPLVEEALSTGGFAYEIIRGKVPGAPETPRPDWVVPPADCLRGVTLRDATQISAVSALLRAGRGIVRLSGGGGKSEIMLAVAKAYSRARVLVLALQIAAVHQTADRCVERLGEAPGIIHRERFEVDRRITFASLATITRAVDDLAHPRHAEALEFLRAQQVVMVDECEIAGAGKLVPVVFAHITTPLRIGVSATPVAQDRRKALAVMGMLGDIVFSMGRSETEALGYTPTLCAHVRHVHEVVPQRKTCRRFPRCIREGMIESAELGAAVAKDVEELGARGIPCVVFTERKEHAWYLLENHLRDVALVTGDESIEARREIFAAVREGGIKCVVATQALDVAVDMPNVKAVLLPGCGKSIRALIQRVARADRLTKARVAHVFVYANHYCAHLKDRAGAQVVGLKELGAKTFWQGGIGCCHEASS